MSLVSMLDGALSLVSPHLLRVEMCPGGPGGIWSNEIRPFSVCVTTSKSLKMLVSQSCPTLCDPMDLDLPGSFIYGILQARILEW